MDTQKDKELFEAMIREKMGLGSLDELGEKIDKLAAAQAEVGGLKYTGVGPVFTAEEYIHMLKNWKPTEGVGPVRDGDLYEKLLRK